MLYIIIKDNSRFCNPYFKGLAALVNKRENC